MAVIHVYQCIEIMKFMLKLKSSIFGAIKLGTTLMSIVISI